MASFSYSPPSSSSVPTGGRTHDIFLSFRGEDTRYNFVDHLYAALVQSGIRVFKDDEMLHRGKLITPELTKAIEESRCVVVVFSKNYVDSSWCLVELAKIMECHNRMGRLVLPVFYHVDPSDLRGQRKNFQTAFRRHEHKFREEMDKVNEWRGL
ncbi:TMV resistance protein N-like [Cynara cardunculus var. scolymus]|uniref:TMV resistance protein N-like n=1 Tax=Cynara cardunculus var. scolymus TaxID=59895 RepID=UPI000D626A7C|nr:TMV resistance protein N-like [Cynara cardunculus var. scolymus]